MRILDLGLIDYFRAYKIQREILEKRKKGIAPDTLIMAEHPPVFTIGRTGLYENLLVNKGILEHKRIKLVEVDRGGDITFHGPGQMVLYPIINLKEKALDIREYIRGLEEFIIAFLRDYNIEGHRIDGLSGVWVDGKKLASIGIGISRWTSFHGVSVNINTDLSYFSMIRSCGIAGVEITSLAKILGKAIDIGLAKKVLISNFESIFQMRPQLTSLRSVSCGLI